MIELLNIDCMEYMATQPDNAFDLAITSPPYNMNLRVRDGKYCSRQIVKELSTKYNNYADNLPMDEYYNFVNGVVTELLRISAVVFFNIQMITGNKPALFKLLGSHAESVKELIIWDKGQGQPAIGRNTLNSRHELLIVFSKNAITRQFDVCNFERGTLDNLWQIGKGKPEIDGHNAGYPKELTDKIILNFANKSDKIFDPFLGTGTTAISAHYFGCDFVGCEIDEDYFNAASERFDRETRQVAMF